MLSKGVSLLKDYCSFWEGEGDGKRQRPQLRGCGQGCPRDMDGGRVDGEELFNSRDGLKVELVGLDMLDVMDNGKEGFMDDFQPPVTEICLCALHGIKYGW